MSGGRVVERGNHESLLRSGGEYSRLWAMQQADDATLAGGRLEDAGETGDEAGDEPDARDGVVKLSARA
jgi:hypothetical protein